MGGECSAYVRCLDKVIVDRSIFNSVLTRRQFRLRVITRPETGSR